MRDMKDLLELRKFYNKTQTEDLVLCTLVRKTGSSYRSVFAKKLVAVESKASVGLLSGGCIEKEIEELACDNFENLPFIKTFNTLSEEDRLMGYQKGCAGVIDILFEKLPKDLDSKDLYLPFGTDPKAENVSISLKPETLGKRHFVSQDIATLSSEYSEDLIFEPWHKPIELTVIGCGADADPYLELSKSLGWSARFIDYRSDLARPDRFNDEDIKPERIPLEQIATSVKEGQGTAVILMTHSFESDLHIFSDLIDKNFGYLGCVGPRRRYELLKKDLKTHFDKTPSEEWESRVVKAPPGITSANHTPVEIAFSIMADIQVRLGGN